MHDARLVPKPVQQPYPPITIGGTGANRTLRLAARWASHWNTVGYDADDYARKCQALDQRCLEIGRIRRRSPARLSSSSRPARTGSRWWNELLPCSQPGRMW